MSKIKRVVIKEDYGLKTGTSVRRGGCIFTVEEDGHMYADVDCDLIHLENLCKGYNAEVVEDELSDDSDDSDAGVDTTGVEDQNNGGDEPEAPTEDVQDAPVEQAKKRRGRGKAKAKVSDDSDAGVDTTGVEDHDNGGDEPEAPTEEVQDTPVEQAKKRRVRGKAKASLK